MKRLIAALSLVCTVCIAMFACQSGEKITEDKAKEIVMLDLGILVNNVSETHVHEGTYNDQPCYNVYVTVGGVPMTYVVSMSGDILHKGTGGHSH